MAKRGRKKAKSVCSFTLNEYDQEDLILIENLGKIPYYTKVHKKFKNKLPKKWKFKSDC